MMMTQLMIQKKKLISFPTKKSRMLASKQKAKKSEMKRTTINVSRSLNVYYSVKLHVEKGTIPTKQ